MAKSAKAFILPSTKRGLNAIERARGRRVARERGIQIKTEWFIDKVLEDINTSNARRVRIATAYVKTRVIQNISEPVVKTTGPKGGLVVTGRSKPGEYPRADYALLMNTIFSHVKKTALGYEGYVGTPLDYGMILELRLNRSFLMKTLQEERETIFRIINGNVEVEA